MARTVAAIMLVLAGCGPATPAPATSRPETSPPPGNAGGEESQEPCADAEACVIEGEALRKGGFVGGPADPAPLIANNLRALDLFRAACTRDHARGCELAADTFMGHEYYGLGENPTATTELYDKACRLGSSHACYRYGFYIWEGLLELVIVDGVLRRFSWHEDREVGRDLLIRACDMGQPEACKLLDEIGRP